MDNNNFWDNKEENENTSSKEENNLPTPEAYYHDIKTPPKEGDDRYYEIFDESKPKSRIWSLASMILGILSVCLFFVEWVSIVLAVSAIALAIVSRYKLKYFDRMAITGLIIGIFGIVFGVFSLVLSDLLEKNIS